MQFGELVKAKGYTLRTLSAAAGVSYRSLEQYSSGRYPWRNARAYLIVPVADALGVHPRDLMALDHPPE